MDDAPFVHVLGVPRLVVRRAPGPGADREALRPAGRAGPARGHGGRDLHRDRRGVGRGSAIVGAGTGPHLRVGTAPRPSGRRAGVAAAGDGDRWLPARRGAGRRRRTTAAGCVRRRDSRPARGRPAGPRRAAAPGRRGSLGRGMASPGRGRPSLDTGPVVASPDRAGRGARRPRGAAGRRSGGAPVGGPRSAAGASLGRLRASRRRAVRPRGVPAAALRRARPRPVPTRLRRCVRPCSRHRLAPPPAVRRRTDGRTVDRRTARGRAPPPARSAGRGVAVVAAVTPW